MTPDEFVAALTAEVPELRSHIAENRVVYGELLLHLLVAEVREWCIAAFNADAREPLARCLGVVDRAMREGGFLLDDAIGVSFVQDSGWWEDEMRPFIESWPAALRAEVERQRNAP